MSGIFYCPHCKEKNACDCKTCSKTETKLKRLSWEDNGEVMICGYCGKTFHPDQSLDMDFKMRGLTSEELRIFLRMIKKDYSYEEIAEIFLIDITRIPVIKKGLII